MHTVFHSKSPLACISLTNIFTVCMFAGLDQMICLSSVINKCFQVPYTGPLVSETMLLFTFQHICILIPALYCPSLSGLNLYAMGDCSALF